MAEEEGFSPEELGDLTPVEQGYTPEELGHLELEDVTPSAKGSFVRRGLQEVPAGAAGGAAGMALMYPGAALGAAVGGPLAPVTGFLGGVAGAVVGGVAASTGVHYVQDKLLELAGLRGGTGFFSEAQQAADEAANPKASFTGELAGGVLPSFGVGRAVMPAARAVGGALQGGMEAAQEVYHGDEEFNPFKIGASIAAGAAFAQPRRWMNPITKPLEAKFAAKPTVTEVNPEVPISPDIEQAMKPEGTDTSGLPTGDFPERQGPNERYSAGELPEDVTPAAAEPKPVDTEIDYFAETRDRINFAYEQIAKVAPEDRPHWEAHAKNLQNQLETWMAVSERLGLVKTISDTDASLGPRGDPASFTPEKMSAANQQQTAAAGTALVQPPPVNNPDTGNVVGSHTANRIAAKANDPSRNYGKGSDTSGLPMDNIPGSPGRPQKKFSTGELPEDITAALAAEKPPEPAPPTPQPPEAPAPVTAAVTPPAREPQRTPMPEGRIRELAEIRRIDDKIYNKEQLTPEEETRYDTYHQDAKDLERNLLNPSRQAAPAPKGTLSLKRPVPAATAEAMKAGRGLREVRPEATKVAEHPDVTAHRERIKSDPASTERFNNLPQAAQEAAAKLYDRAINPPEPTTRPEEQLRKSASGAQVKDLETKKRHDNAIAAVKNAVDFPTIKDEVASLLSGDKAAVLSHARKTLDTATSLNDGKNPVHRTEGYQPNEEFRPPEWNIVKAAWDVVRNPGDSKTAVKLRSEYVKRLVTKGEIETDVDTDIAKNKKKVEYNEAVDYSGSDKDTLENFWAEHAVEEVPTLEHQQGQPEYNALVDYVKELTPEQWRAASKEYDGKLGDLIQDTNHPDRLLAELKDALDVRASKRATPKNTAIQEAWKFLTNTGAKMAKDEGAGVPGHAALFMPEKLFNKLFPSMTHALPEPKEHTPEETSTLKQFHKMMGDESGGGNIGMGLYNWMVDLKNSYTTPGPRVRDATHDYAKALQADFTKLANDRSQYKYGLLVGSQRAKFADGTTLADRGIAGSTYRAIEGKERSLLPAEVQDYLKAHIDPLMARYNAMFPVVKRYMEKHQLPGWDKFPEPGDNGNGFAEFFPRMQKGDAPWDAHDTTDPVTGQSLTYRAGTTKERGYFSIQNTAGERLVYVPGEDKITILRNGAPQIVKTQKFDPAKIGETIDLKIKGVEDKWTVDHAKIDEIRDGNGKNPDGTWKVEYYDDPLLTANNAVDTMHNTLERLRVYDKMVESQYFQDVQRPKHTSREDMPANYAQTSLPPFADKGTWFPKHIAWALDDFYARGFHWENNHAKAAYDRLAADSAKIFYFFGPLVHVFNEANKWAIGRGWQWLPGSGGWKNLVETGMEAFKDTWSNNRVLEREMVNAGANLMYMHSVTSQIMPKIGREIGTRIGAEPHKWDPIAKKFGITTPELGANLYEKSTSSMWWASDLLAKQRYLELKRSNPGLSNEMAVKGMHDFIDSYVLPVTVGGNGDHARFMKKLLSDPALSLFGPYHYGLFHTITNMSNNLIGPNATKAQRIEAAGHWTMALAMMYAVYPALSAGYAMVTGNQHSEVEARGVTRLMNTAADLTSGKKGWQDMSRNFFTASVPLDTVVRNIENQDFTGKPIVSPQNFRSPGKALKMVGQEAEFLAGQIVSPYKTISQAANRPGADGLSIAWHFAESMLGLKTPSPGSIKHDAHRERLQRIEAKQRDKHPHGLIERGANAAARTTW